MMREKSPPSELILEIIKSEKSLRFLKEFGKGYTFYFCQNIILFLFSHLFKKGQNSAYKVSLIQKH